MLLPRDIIEIGAQAGNDQYTRRNVNVHVALSVKSTVLAEKITGSHHNIFEYAPIMQQQIWRFNLNYTICFEGWSFQLWKSLERALFKRFMIVFRRFKCRCLAISKCILRLKTAFLLVSMVLWSLSLRWYRNRPSLPHAMRTRCDLLNSPEVDIFEVSLSYIQHIANSSLFLRRYNLLFFL